LVVELLIMEQVVEVDIMAVEADPFLRRRVLAVAEVVLPQIVY